MQVEQSRSQSKTLSMDSPSAHRMWRLFLRDRGPSLFAAPSIFRSTQTPTSDTNAKSIVSSGCSSASWLDLIMKISTFGQQDGSQPSSPAVLSFMSLRKGLVQKDTLHRVHLSTRWVKKILWTVEEFTARSSAADECFFPGALGTPFLVGWFFSSKCECRESPLRRSKLASQHRGLIFGVKNHRDAVLPPGIKTTFSVQSLMAHEPFQSCNIDMAALSEKLPSRKGRS